MMSQLMIKHCLNNHSRGPTQLTRIISWDLYENKILLNGIQAFNFKEQEFVVCFEHFEKLFAIWDIL